MQNCPLYSTCAFDPKFKHYLKCRRYAEDPWRVIREPFTLVQSNCEVSDLCHLGLFCTCGALSSSTLIEQKGLCDPSHI